MYGQRLQTTGKAKMKTLVVIAAALLMSLTAYGENSTTAQGVLEIKITNIENGHGTIYIAILDMANSRPTFN
jgi:hypothetical protein